MPLATSPVRTLRSKRDSMTITRSMGKTLADVVNNEHQSTDPERASTSTGMTTRSSVAREAGRTRLSLDSIRANANNERVKASTAKLVKSPAKSSSLKSTKRTMGPPPPPSSILKGTPKSKENAEKPSKSRASLSLRGLSSALQPKGVLQPSSLPKYKTKYSKPDAVELSQKRSSDWDDREGAENCPQNSGVHENDDGSDEDFIQVSRPISPLPKRATRKPMIPIAVSLTPSTPQKKGFLHKATDALASNSPRTKAAKLSASPMSRLRAGQTTSRSPSAASVSSQQRNSCKLTSVSHVDTTPTHKKTATISPASSSKLELSPSNPFHLPDTSGASLLSPPLSPSLEGISLDSVDAGDVSALLATVISPVKPSTGPSDEPSQPPPPGLPSQTLRIFPSNNTLAPQTPAGMRTTSILTTDPRQSILSLRQILEQSGDLEHLLSQPLPSSIFTPDARERLLSFGSMLNRPEPQTPSPVHEGGFTSISQVLFPSLEDHAEEAIPNVAGPLIAQIQEEANRLRVELSQAENLRIEHEGRILDLERQLILSREAREQEAADLGTQVTDLEERLQDLLSDRERETEYRKQEMESRLREMDMQWEQQVAVTISRVQKESAAVYDRDRRIKHIENVAMTWDNVKLIAGNELELLRSNKRFVEIILAGLDISIMQLRNDSQC